MRTTRTPPTRQPCRFVASRGVSRRLADEPIRRLNGDLTGSPAAARTDRSALSGTDPAPDIGHPTDFPALRALYPAQPMGAVVERPEGRDRKSTRLNSSHEWISR